MCSLAACQYSSLVHTSTFYTHDHSLLCESMYMYMRQFQSPSRLIVSAILRPPARHLHLFSLQCITVHIHSSGPAITAQPEINHTHLFQTLKRLLIIYQNGFSLTEWNSLHPGYLQLGYMCRPQQQVNTPPPVKARGLSLRENQRST